MSMTRRLYSSVYTWYGCTCLRLERITISITTMLDEQTSQTS